MRTRTLIGIVVIALVLSLAVAGGLRWADGATSATASASSPDMQQSADESPVQRLPVRPVVPEPDDPVATDLPVLAEPLASPTLAPRRAPALEAVPRPGTDRVTVAVVVLSGASAVPEPEDPVFADGTDLAERIVVPELSRSELLPPSPPRAAGDCRTSPWEDAL